MYWTWLSVANKQSPTEEQEVGHTKAKMKMCLPHGDLGLSLQFIPSQLTVTKSRAA